MQEGQRQQEGSVVDQTAVNEFYQAITGHYLDHESLSYWFLHTKGVIRDVVKQAVMARPQTREFGVLEKEDVENYQKHGPARVEQRTTATTARTPNQEHTERMQAYAKWKNSRGTE
jgi:hypothetical protein